jgi:hypothetical protein
MTKENTESVFGISGIKKIGYLSGFLFVILFISYWLILNEGLEERLAGGIICAAAVIGGGMVIASRASLKFHVLNDGLSIKHGRLPITYKKDKIYFWNENKFQCFYITRDGQQINLFLKIINLYNNKKTKFNLQNIDRFDKMLDNIKEFNTNLEFVELKSVIQVIK